VVFEVLTKEKNKQTKENHQKLTGAFLFIACVAGLGWKK